MYSPSTGNVYCYVCTLFRSGSDSFSPNGFNDWKNAHRITTHERSDSHLVAVKKGFENANAHHVDSAIAKQLDRTPQAHRCRCYLLGREKTPVPRPHRVVWAEGQW